MNPATPAEEHYSLVMENVPHGVLVKHCAELYGGTVTASSAPGEGTRFVVCLPIPGES